MSDPFLAEIKIFAGAFAIKGYAFCDGQTLPIGQNSMLFALIGTTYGGDGRTTVGLPNYQGRAAMHWGTGPGLTRRVWGETTGIPGIRLTLANLPSHTHGPWKNSIDAPTSPEPKDLYPNRHLDTDKARVFAQPTNLSAQFAPQQIGSEGGDQEHYNMQPFLVMNFLISLDGIWPPRS